MIRKIKLLLFEYFHYNKQERNGVFVLLSIFIVIFLVRIFSTQFFSSRNNSQIIAVNLNSNYTQQKKEFDLQQSTTVHSVNKQLFVFNPNTISIDEAMQLGFSKKTATTLVNFRNKGGKFKTAEDLKKLYGLSTHLYNKLEPYILIQNNSIIPIKTDTVNFKTNHKTTYTPNVLEINAADSLSIVYLKGIGPGFTKRIMKYRQMLGGFHSINQLKDVYGINDSIFNVLSNQIKIDKELITKIPINEVDFNTLRKHPYFNFQTAQVIINYRFKHGKIYLENIKELGIFSEEKLANILPYLSY